MTNPRKQRKEYAGEEKAAYKLEKEKEKQGMNPAKAKEKVVNTNWTMGHQAIKDSIIEDRENAKQCTRCGFDRDTGAEFYRPIQVSVVGRSSIRGQRYCEKKPEKAMENRPKAHPR